jgi:catechol-2,3-dioxygenase
VAAQTNDCSRSNITHQQSTSMIDASKAFSGFSVDNIENAKDFYQNTLGLKVNEPMPGTMQIEVGNNPVFVYQKDDHQPASYTMLNFPVESVEQTVTDLTNKGVKFEQYSGQMATDARGIHAQENMKIAWFKDPAGNYLSVVEGQM